jgi:hypothetical protein
MDCVILIVDYCKKNYEVFFAAKSIPNILHEIDVYANTLEK